MGSAGKVSDEPIELVDLYRTLADLAGLPQPPAPSPTDGTAVQGKSLVPVLERLSGGPRKCDRHLNSRCGHGMNWHCRVWLVAALDRTVFTGHAFSQITRCLSGYTDSGVAKFYPCLSNTHPVS